MKKTILLGIFAILLLGIVGAQNFSDDFNDGVCDNWTDYYYSPSTLDCSNFYLFSNSTVAVPDFSLQRFNESEALQIEYDTFIRHEGLGDGSGIINADYTEVQRIFYNWGDPSITLMDAGQSCSYSFSDNTFYHIKEIWKDNNGSGFVEIYLNDEFVCKRYITFQDPAFYILADFFISEGNPSGEGFSNVDNFSMEYVADCTEDWTCNAWSNCNPDSTRDCVGAIDLNSCHEEYTGNYSELGHPACEYSGSSLQDRLVFGLPLKTDISDVKGNTWNDMHLFDGVNYGNYYFNGTHAYVYKSSLNTSDDVRLTTGNFTYCIKANMPSPRRQGFYYEHDDSDPNNRQGMFFMMSSSTGYTRVVAVSETSGHVSDSVSAVGFANTEQNYCLSYDTVSDIFYVYVDSIVVDDLLINLNPLNESYIGLTQITPISPGANRFLGFVREACGWSRTLSPEEIAQYSTDGCTGELNLPSCTEDWAGYTTDCSFNKRTKYYIDGNACGTTVNLPLDNGTQETCAGTCGYPNITQYGVGANAYYIYKNGCVSLKLRKNYNPSIEVDSEAYAKPFKLLLSGIEEKETNSSNKKLTTFASLNMTSDITNGYVEYKTGNNNVRIGYILDENKIKATAKIYGWTYQYDESDLWLRVLYKKGVGDIIEYAEPVVDGTSKPVVLLEQPPEADNSVMMQKLYKGALIILDPVIVFTTPYTPSHTTGEVVGVVVDFGVEYGLVIISMTGLIALVMLGVWAIKKI